MILQQLMNISLDSLLFQLFLESLQRFRFTFFTSIKLAKDWAAMVTSGILGRQWPDRPTCCDAWARSGGRDWGVEQFPGSRLGQRMIWISMNIYGPHPKSCFRLKRFEKGVNQQLVRSSHEFHHESGPISQEWCGASTVWSFDQLWGGGVDPCFRLWGVDPCFPPIPRGGCQAHCLWEYVY